MLNQKVQSHAYPLHHRKHHYLWCELLLSGGCFHTRTNRFEQWELNETSQSSCSWCSVNYFTYRKVAHIPMTLMKRWILPSLYPCEWLPLRGDNMSWREHAMHFQTTPPRWPAPGPESVHRKGKCVQFYYVCEWIPWRQIARPCRVVASHSPWNPNKTVRAILVFYESFPILQISTKAICGVWRAVRDQRTSKDAQKCICSLVFFSSAWN